MCNYNGLGLGIPVAPELQVAQIWILFGKPTPVTQVTPGPERPVKPWRSRHALDSMHRADSSRLDNGDARGRHHLERSPRQRVGRAPRATRRGRNKLDVEGIDTWTPSPLSLKWSDLPRSNPQCPHLMVVTSF